MTEPQEYCRKCGVFLSGGMIDRDEDDATLCWECGDNDLWAISDDAQRAPQHEDGP